MNSNIELREMLRDLFVNSMQISHMILGVVAQSVSEEDVPRIVEEANNMIREMCEQQCDCDEVQDGVDADNVSARQSKTLH